MTRNALITAWLAGVFFTALVPTTSYAQSEPAAAGTSEQAAPEIPEDALGRGTPRGAASGFLHAVQDQDYETAAEYLDFRNLPRNLELSAEDGPRLAEEFQLALDRRLWVDIAALSNDPKGLVGDGLPLFRDRLGIIKTSTGDVELLLQRVPRGDGVFIWKISNVTVSRIPALYEEFSYSPYVEMIRSLMPDVRFLGAELFKWVIGLSAAVISYFVLLFVARLVLVRAVKPDRPLREPLWRFIRAPLLVLIALTIGWHIIVKELGVGVIGQEIARARTLMTIFTAWTIVAAISLLRDGYSRRLQRLERQSAIVLLRPIATAFKIVVVLFAALFWLDNVGFNITTLLAGLGVGGIAIALVLQKPLEDVFGAITLYTQQPIRVGDFCRFGDQAGIVEEIGLRATRGRTLDKTLITIPNAKLAGEYIDNFSMRDRFRYKPTIRLRYDSTPDQIRNVLEGIRNLIDSHPKTVKEGARVRFETIGQHSFDIKPNVYLETKDYAEFLEITEELNLKIMDIVAESGTSFAFPLAEAVPGKKMKR